MANISSILNKVYYHKNYNLSHCFNRKTHTRYIKTLADDAFHYEALTNDPQITVKSQLPTPGWNLLEIKIKHNLKNAAIFSLYYDSGHGFNEDECIFLPLISEQYGQRIFYLPVSTKRIRLDPLEHKGKFSLCDLKISWLANHISPKKLHQQLLNININKPIIEIINQSAKRANKPVEYILPHLFSEMHKIHDRKHINYPKWIDKCETPYIPKTNNIDTRTAPLISIVLPVYNINVYYLRECINSVLNQIYPKWELCIVDDASTNLNITSSLLDYQNQDSRIKVIIHQENQNISLATNSAISMSNGEYTAFLDQDDTLAPQALFKVAESIMKNKITPLLIYTDEDKITTKNKRFRPHFKPDWNPDLLLSQNYINHLTVIKSALLKKIGRLRKGYEGSQDHDMLIRCLPYLTDKSVVHIPEILYHWRTHKNSVSHNTNKKKYTTQAGLMAIQSYLSQHHPKARVEAGILPNTYRVKWPILGAQPLVSLIIPTRDKVNVLKPCIDKILTSNYKNFEIIIIDNLTECPKTLDYLKQIQRNRLVKVYQWKKVFNYSSINNYGVKLAKGSILGFLNNDIEPINNDWLDELLSHCCRKEIGCVGAKLYYPNDTIQHAGVVMGVGGIAAHSHKRFKRESSGYYARLKLIQNYSVVTGACLFIRREVFIEVGGFESSNLPVAFNDVDLCLKALKAGYRNLWTPYAELYHHESYTRGKDNTLFKKARAKKESNYMRTKWQEFLNKTDPAYNPNLSITKEDFSLPDKRLI